MDQDSTGSEDDANSIKDGIYFINDLSFYFPIGCYTLCALILTFMLGREHGRKPSSTEDHSALHQSQLEDTCNASDSVEF